MSSPALPEAERVFEGIVASPIEDGPGPRHTALVALDGMLDGAILEPLPLTVRVTWDDGPDVPDDPGGPGRDSAHRAVSGDRAAHGRGHYKLSWRKR